MYVEVTSWLGETEVYDVAKSYTYIHIVHVYSLLVVAQSLSHTYTMTEYEHILDLMLACYCWKNLTTTCLAISSESTATLTPIADI